MSRIVRTIAMAVGLFSGVVCSQAPEFAQQYRQRIGGGIDELKRVVSRFEADAARVGQSVSQAIEALRISPDQLVRARGEAAIADRDRLENLERQRNEMQQSGPFFRVAYMLKGVDPALARATYAAFEPAVPVTQEGILSAVIGFLFGGGLTLFLTRIMRTLFGGRKKPQIEPETTRTVPLRMPVLDASANQMPEQKIKLRTIEDDEQR